MATRKGSLKALRNKENRDATHTTIKCYLMGKLIVKDLREPIEEMVLATSILAHKASMVLNRMIIHLLKNGMELPDLNNLTLFRQFFMIGNEGKIL
jgi:hypothetical protein